MVSSTCNHAPMVDSRGLGAAGHAFGETLEGFPNHG